MIDAPPAAAQGRRHGVDRGGRRRFETASSRLSTRNENCVMNGQSGRYRAKQIFSEIKAKPLL